MPVPHSRRCSHDTTLLGAWRVDDFRHVVTSILLTLKAAFTIPCLRMSVYQDLVDKQYKQLPRRLQQHEIRQ